MNLGVAREHPTSTHVHRIPAGIIIVGAWSVPAALSIIETYAFTRIAGRPFSIAAISVRESATWATYAVLTPVMLRMAERFPLRTPVFWRRLLLHFVVAILIGALAATAATSATRVVETQATPASQLFVGWFLSGLPVAILSYFAVIGAAHAINYFGEAQGRREDGLRLEAQLADARLAALQGRLHPHFLFNTLNAITVLVRDGDIAKSTRMLELLSAMLRQVLDGSLPQIVPLRTELALLRQYLEIEEVRFSDRLTVVFEVEAAALDAGVPALVTQPLAENAIRHAVARTSRFVVIRIVARLRTTDGGGGSVLDLAVEDDGPGLTDGWEKRRAVRTGLSATAMRLVTLYAASGSLHVRARRGGGTVSAVSVPYAVVSDLEPPERPAQRETCEV